MSKSIKLPNSEHVVNFVDYMSSKADTVFQTQYEKAITISTNGEGKPIVTGIKSELHKKAYYLAFPLVVESVYLKDSGDALPKSDYNDFLDNLSLADFNTIKIKIEKMKEEGDQLLIEAKK